MGQTYQEMFVITRRIEVAELKSEKKLQYALRQRRSCKVVGLAGQPRLQVTTRCVQADFGSRSRWQADKQRRVLYDSHLQYLRARGGR